MAFRRVLRPFDATMVVIGGIIGSGLFINPRLVAQSLGSTVLVLIATGVPVFYYVAGRTI